MVYIYKILSKNSTDNLFSSVMITEQNQYVLRRCYTSHSTVSILINDLSNKRPKSFN